MRSWPSALLSTIRAGASPAARGMEIAADCPAANTVSNRSDRHFFAHALLGGHRHMEAVGFIDVGD
jgi:hypothetical protein